MATVQLNGSPAARDGHAPAAQLADRARNDSAQRWLLALADALAVMIALVGATTLSPMSPRDHQPLWSLVAVPLIMVLFKVYGLYDRDVKRISHSTVDDLPWLFHATVIGGLVLWLYSRYSPMGRLDFVELLLFGISAIALVAVARFSVRGIAARMIGPERALLVGDGRMACALVAKLAAHPEHRIDVIGALRSPRTAPALGNDGLARLGTVEELEAVATRHGVARIVLCGGDVEDRNLEELLRRSRSLSLKVSVLPRLSDVLGPAVEVDDVEGVTVLGVNPPWLPPSSRALKRAMDFVVAATFLVLASPLLAALAIAVRIDSRGPVLFAQERVGRAGKRFRLFKFRTMVPDAEARRPELLLHSSDPNWLHLEHDPRITRLGHTLRRLSLDELPQLWNVVKGEMSMVGPRPLIPAEDERVQGWARGRVDLTPGITGYWQVLGRTRIPFEEMVKLDYLYVMNWSLWEDIRLMLKTGPVVVKGRGVN